MADKLSIDEKLVRKLADLLNETGLTEIEYEAEGRRIRIAKGGGAAMIAPAALAAPAAAPAAAAPAASLRASTAWSSIRVPASCSKPATTSAWPWPRGISTAMASPTWPRRLRETARAASRRWAW